MRTAQGPPTLALGWCRTADPPLPCHRRSHLQAATDPQPPAHRHKPPFSRILSLPAVAGPGTIERAQSRGSHPSCQAVHTAFSLALSCSRSLALSPSPSLLFSLSLSSTLSLSPPPSLIHSLSGSLRTNRERALFLAGSLSHSSPSHSSPSHSFTLALRSADQSFMRGRCQSRLTASPHKRLVCASLFRLIRTLRRSRAARDINA